MQTIKNGHFHEDIWDTASPNERIIAHDIEIILDVNEPNTDIILKSNVTLTIDAKVKCRSLNANIGSVIIINDNLTAEQSIICMGNSNNYIKVIGAGSLSALQIKAKYTDFLYCKLKPELTYAGLLDLSYCRLYRTEGLKWSNIGFNYLGNNSKISLISTTWIQTIGSILHNYWIDGPNFKASFIDNDFEAAIILDSRFIMEGNIFRKPYILDGTLKPISSIDFKPNYYTFTGPSKIRKDEFSEFKIGDTVMEHMPTSVGIKKVYPPNKEVLIVPEYLEVLVVEPTTIFIVKSPEILTAVINKPSDNFMVSIGEFQELDEPLDITLSDTDAGGKFSVEAITLPANIPGAKAYFTYTPIRKGLINISPGNIVLKVIDEAKSYLLTCEHTDCECSSPLPITVSLPPNTAISGKIYISFFDDGKVAGEFDSPSIVLSNSKREATVNYRARTWGKREIHTLNDTDLSDPTPLKLLAKVQVGSSRVGYKPERTTPDRGGYNIFNEWTSPYFKQFSSINKGRPKDKTSDEIIALTKETSVSPEGSAEFYVDCFNFTESPSHTWGIPGNCVSGNEPEKPIIVHSYINESDSGPVPFRNDLAIENDAGMPKESSPNADKHCYVDVRDEDSGGISKVIETFVTWMEGDTFHCEGLAIFMPDKGQRPFFMTSAIAAGFPASHLFLRYDELSRGAINHALYISLPNGRCRAGATFVYPATHGVYTNGGKEGWMMGDLGLLTDKAYEKYSQLFEVGSQARIVLETMRSHGVYVGDISASTAYGKIYLSGVSDERWKSEDLNRLSLLKSGDFYVAERIPSLTFEGKTKAKIGEAVNITVKFHHPLGQYLFLYMTVNNQWAVFIGTDDHYNFIRLEESRKEIILQWIPEKNGIFEINATIDYGYGNGYPYTKPLIIEVDEPEPEPEPEPDYMEIIQKMKRIQVLQKELFYLEDELDELLEKFDAED